MDVVVGITTGTTGGHFTYGFRNVIVVVDGSVTTMGDTVVVVVVMAVVIVSARRFCIVVLSGWVVFRTGDERDAGCRRNGFGLPQHR